MPQSYSSILTHIVFSTKNRAPYITDAVKSELFSYLAGAFKELNAGVILINGVENHVHILAYLPRDAAPSDIIKKVKANSSKWIKNHFPELKEFNWQTGYGIFSVSQSKSDEINKYISNQAEHHKKMSFEDEFRAILRKHGIEFDADHFNE
jgi:REP element-mobilizing transposase RayT